MKVAVTGASGHIGSNLCPELSKRNYSLRLLKYQADVFHSGGVEIIEGDLSDIRSLLDLVEGVDVVIHLAAKISISGRDRELLFKTNEEGTRNVVEACLSKKVRRLVHFSSIHTYNPYPLDEVLDETREHISNRATNYDLSKVAGEKYVWGAKELGLETVIITPTSVFGPNDPKPSLLGNAIIDIYNGKIPTLVPGGYDFVYVEDLVKGVISAIDNGRNGEKYLMSGQYLTIRELAKIIGEVGNVRVTQRVLSSKILKMLIPFFQLQSKISNKPPIFTTEALKALIDSNRKVSSQKAEKDLGYTKTPFDEAIKTTLKWYKSNGDLIDRK